MLPALHPLFLLSVHHKNVPCVPAPPEAMTGMLTAFPAIVRVSSISYPAFVPSQSILVRRISPAPSCFSFHCPFNGINVLYPHVRRFYKYSSHCHLASSLCINCNHHTLAAKFLCRFTNQFRTVMIAAELTEILSAPSRRSTLKSSTVRIPPPTVNGINTLCSNFAYHINYCLTLHRRMP